MCPPNGDKAYARRLLAISLVFVAALAGPAAVGAGQADASGVVSRSDPRPSPTSPQPTAPRPSAPSPSPAPGQPGTPAPSTDSDGRSCGIMFDPVCIAGKAMTSWFKSLVRSAKEPMLRLLGSTVLSTPSLDSDEMARTRQLHASSALIANTCFVLLITFAGVLLMTGTLTTREYALKDILVRIVFAFVAVNTSQIVIGYAIDAANGLSSAFLTFGDDRTDPQETARVIDEMVDASLTSSGVFFTLMALVVVVLAVIVAFVYVIRLAIIMLLITAAPIALMCHALPQTEGLAFFWWRALAGMLGIQIAQSLVFATALQLLFTRRADGGGEFIGVPTSKSSGLDLLLLMALMWVLIRIPAWIGRSVWHSARPGMLGQLIKTYVVYRGTGAVLKKLTPSRHRVIPPSRTPRKTGTQRQALPSNSQLPHKRGQRPRKRPVATTHPAGPRNPHQRGPAPGRPQPRHGHRADHGKRAPDPGPVLGWADVPGRVRPHGPAGQMALFPRSIPARRTAEKAPREPVQLTLFEAKQRPQPPRKARPRPTPPAKTAAPQRGRQVMLPGLPRRPVPHRQMSLRLDPPASKLRRKGRKK